MSFGRCPLRIAIGDPTTFVEPKVHRTLEECRADLRAAVHSWPATSPRLAIAGDTGLGKTTLALELCVRHAAGRCGLEGILLYVVHDRRRVQDMVARLRSQAKAEHLPPGSFADLLGRQAIYPEQGEDWATLRFGCKESARASRAGRRGRRVQVEVCQTCPHRDGCQAQGFLRHTRDAGHAPVVVTTVAKLADLPDGLWKKVSAVLCDEDVLGGLLRDFTVTYGDLHRARRWIRRQGGLARRRPYVTALRAVLPLLDGACAVLSGPESSPASLLVMSLPEECEQFATEQGHADLVKAMPRRTVRRRDGVRDWRYDPKAPAPWERGGPGRFPRQTWGRFLSAIAADLRSGDGLRNATVEITPSARGRRARLRVHRFDRRAIERLRSRPLLLLDATLHPAVAHVLDVQTVELRYDQGRTILQALGSLGRLEDLSTVRSGRRVLSTLGHRTLAQVAAFFEGRRGYVLCRPGIADVLRREARAYDELRRAEFVTVRRERGWDARSDALVFVVLGRYARDGDSCRREARALRAVLVELWGSSRALDSFTPTTGVFLGRGQPATYFQEPVERTGRRLEDPLAAALQDADRIATVRQFIGRDRSGRSEVLLLRGDPTVGVDGLYDARDLPVAIPARARRLAGGRSVP